MSKNNVSLSLDISSKCTGWSIFKEEKLDGFGTITIKSKQHVSKKLNIYMHELIDICEKYEPTSVIYEDVYLRNVITLKTLSYFIGVTQAVSSMILDVEPESVYTTTVRSTFNIKGKLEAYKYVKKLYKKELSKYTFKTGNDITDSILQGLYYLQKDAS